MESCGRPNRQLLFGPVGELTEADRTASLFVFRNLMLILASFLHVVAVAGLDPVGAIDLLSDRTLVCHGINDTLVVGGESWLSLKDLTKSASAQKDKHEVKRNVK